MNCNIHTFCVFRKEVYNILKKNKKNEKLRLYFYHFGKFKICTERQTVKRQTLRWLHKMKTELKVFTGVHGWETYNEQVQLMLTWFNRAAFILFT